LRLPDLDMVLWAGDAPPEGVHATFDLDEFLDLGALAQYQRPLRSLRSDEVASLDTARRYHLSAAPIYLNTLGFWANDLDVDQLAAQLQQWVDALAIHRVACDAGQERRFFAEALTADGFTSTWHTHALPRQWRIDAPWGCDTHGPLTLLREAAIRYGLNVQCAMHPFMHDKIAQLIIPELGLCITTFNTGNAERVLDMNQSLPITKHLTRETKQKRQQDHALFDHLAARAVEFLVEARQARNHIEQYFDECMDLTAAEEYIVRFVNQITDTCFLPMDA